MSMFKKLVVAAATAAPLALAFSAAGQAQDEAGIPEACGATETYGDLLACYGALWTAAADMPEAAKDLTAADIALYGEKAKELGADIAACQNRVRFFELKEDHDKLSPEERIAFGHIIRDDAACNEEVYKALDNVLGPQYDSVLALVREETALQLRVADHLIAPQP